MSVSSIQDCQRCRLCALPASSNSLISFFDTDFEPMIAKLTSFGIRIRKDDGLPESICQGCTGILTTFIETWELFSTADKKLKKILEISNQTKPDGKNAQTSGSIGSKRSRENKESKRKSDPDDIEIVETKRAKRSAQLNLLRKPRTPLDDSRNGNVEEFKPKSVEKSEETELRKKQRRKESLRNRVRKDSSDSLSGFEDLFEEIETEESDNWEEGEESSNFEEVIEIVKDHDHNYGIANVEEETSPENESIDNSKVQEKIKTSQVITSGEGIHEESSEVQKEFKISEGEKKPQKKPSKVQKEIKSPEKKDSGSEIRKTTSKIENEFESPKKRNSGSEILKTPPKVEKAKKVPEGKDSGKKTQKSPPKVEKRMEIPEEKDWENEAIPSKVEKNVKVSKESVSGNQSHKTTLKNVKILTWNRESSTGQVQLQTPTTPKSLPSVYTQPSDDKEIDVFTCLECHQISWNRKVTLEHIYKIHAQGAPTYKARYMVKRIKNAKAINSEKQIVCLFCFLKFEDTSSYLEHVTLHSMEIYKCVHCRENFSSREALQKHQHFHKDDIIHCQICDKSMTLEIYKRHARSHSLQARIQSAIDKRRSEAFGLMGNDKEKEGRKILDIRNGVSGIVTIKEEELKKKTLMDGNGSLDTENSSNDTQQRPEVAKENQSVGKVQKKRRKKIRVENPKEKPSFYKCLDCLQILKDRGTILKHIQRVHPSLWTNKKGSLPAKKLETDDNEAEGDEVFMCRICPCDLESESKFLCHSEAHHYCKYCEKTFYHKAELKIHQSSHEKPFRCDICDASFYVEKNYEDHKLTHSYQCEFCKASYRTMESLSNHKKVVHTKISCPICSMGFESNWLLSQHEATHVKKKTKTLCEHCGKSYSNVTRFKRHVASHNLDSEFACQFCAMCFKSAVKLKRHQRFSHLSAYTESLRESVENSGAFDSDN